AIGRRRQQASDARARARRVAPSDRGGGRAVRPASAFARGHRGADGIHAAAQGGFLPVFLMLLIAPKARRPGSAGESRTVPGPCAKPCGSGGTSHRWSRAWAALGAAPRSASRLAVADG